MKQYTLWCTVKILGKKTMTTLISITVLLSFQLKNHVRDFRENFRNYITASKYILGNIKKFKIMLQSEAALYFFTRTCFRMLNYIIKTHASCITGFCAFKKSCTYFEQMSSLHEGEIIIILHDCFGNCIVCCSFTHHH